MKEAVVEVGIRTLVPKFETTARLKGLRRWVEVHLAERGLKHLDAAKRAKCSRTYWSRMMNAQQITTQDLEKIARGLGTTPALIIKACKP